MGKITTKVQKIDIIMGVIMQIYLLFPWMQTGEKRYNNFVYLIQTFRTDDYLEMYKATFLQGVKELPDTARVVALWFYIAIITFLIIQILELLHVLVSIRGHFPDYIQVIAWLIVMVITAIISTIGIDGYSIGGDVWQPIVSNSLYIYLALFLVLEGLWILGRKAVESWDEASRRMKEERQEKKEYKKERKKRLNFPGRYSKLYYQVLWKAFLHRWRDFSFLFLSVFLATLFLFTGISMRSIFSNSYGNDQGLLGLGLVEIMRDFLVVILLITLFLITVVLVFYRKKRMVDNGVFQILGIRSDAGFASWIGELLGGLLVAAAGGLAVGKVFLFIFCVGMERLLPIVGKLGRPGVFSYVLTFLVMIPICLFAFGLSHDIQSEKESTDVRGAAIRSEKLPGRYRYLGLITGGALAVYCLYRYSQRRTAESILVLSVFFVCLYVVIYNLWGIRMRHSEKNLSSYLSNLPEQHMLRHRYQTTVRYISIFTVIHISVLFFFCMKMVSSQIASEPEALFPYEYVLLANSQDEGFLDELRDGCQGEVLTFPMVRATTVDNTETPSKPKEIVYQQGQNIGISEETYWKLKELAGETERQDLDLDAAGEKIYIVYQQDQASKVKPLDWYMGTKQPYLHIGQPLFGYNGYEYRKYYPQRIISGEERNSLIGCFKQGKYENLVVFSDEYFNQVKDNWKTEDMYTGETLNEEDAILEKNVHEGSTVLALIHVPEEYQEAAEKIIVRFQEAHTYDESFDPLVKSAYSRSESVRQREIERLLETTVNGFVIIMLLVVGLILLHMKVKMELPEMQKRYRFMECFGMHQKDRVKAEKKEIARFVWIPLGLTACIVPIFTWMVFYLRGFSVADMLRYGAYAGVISVGYILIQILNLRILQHAVIRKVEGS